MYHQPMKTFVFTIAALFVVAPLVLAAEPSAGTNPAWQGVGATQGQDRIVSHGPKPADPGRDTDVWPSGLLGGVGATQGQDRIVSHGPKPADPGRDTDVRLSGLRGGVGAMQK